jgi:multidrug resistance efflux pump
MDTISHGGLNQQLLRLTELVQLGARAREAGRDELPFVIVNESVRAIAYDQAALWDVRSEKVVALSGAARFEPGSPYILMLNRLYRSVVGLRKQNQAHLLDAEIVERVRAAEDVPLAPHLLWWPLQLYGQTVAVLLLGRRDPWTEGDRLVLEALCGSYAQAWELARVPLAPVRPDRRRRMRTMAIGFGVAAVLALGLMPVRSSTIAPAEVVADAPAFVRAPFAGVVDSIAVPPNAAVHAGQLLVRLERRQLEAEYSVAANALDVATAQYRQISQEAIADPRAREQLASVRGKLDEARAEFEYRKARLARAEIVAPADGVAVFNDPAEWIGRPVEIGERILQVAPAESSRIEIELPAADTTTFEEGAEVSFFSNLHPDEPQTGRLVFLSYSTSLTPTGVLSYTDRADLNGGKLRLGLKGTAKVFGPRRPLALWLLRRPLAFLRQLIA